MFKESLMKLFTLGGQTSLHDYRMFYQIDKALISIFIVLWMITTLITMPFITSFEKLKVTGIYHYAVLMNDLGAKNVLNVPVNGHSYTIPIPIIAKHAYFKQTADTLKARLLKAALSSVIISLVIIVMMAAYFVMRGRKKAADVFIRGGSFEESKDVKALIIANDEASPFKIDDFPLIKDAEVQHLLVHGTLGMGKSQLIMKLLDQLRARGDRVIIYDKGCSFTSIYFDETQDVLLNPYDERCANWNLWKEAPKDADLENQAQSLIPIEGESQPFFIHAARAVFSATASRMRRDSDCSLKKLLQFLLTGEFSQMEPYLAGTPAATLMSDKVEKMAISVRAMITTYVRSLQALLGLEESDKKPFCIRDYILDENAKGWLFISSNGEKHNSLKPLMSMWLSIASLALLSLPENLDRRIWFICDELPSLHQLPFLRSTLAEVRKFGGCFILGMQNFAQLAQVYGTKGADDIFDLLNTRFYFRSPSANMAKMVSVELCNEELEEVKESTSYGANSIRDGVSLSNQRTSRPLIDYSEIMRLRKMSCFVRLPGDYPITKLDLKLEVRPKTSKGFIERTVDDVFKSDSSHAAEPQFIQEEDHAPVIKKRPNVEFYV